MRRCVYPIVFGAQGKPNKGLWLYREGKKMVIRIGEVQGEHNYGESFEPKEYIADYTELWFCKKESLIAFKTVLEEAIKEWEAEE